MKDEKNTNKGEKVKKEDSGSKGGAMDIGFLKKLSELMKTENLKTLEISEKDARIFLVKHDGGVREVRSVTGPVEYVADNAHIGSAPVPNDKKGFEVKSPLVGIYYAAPSPDSAPYVTEGKRIKKGDVLCIVEAMKQMNEIVAEIDGEVAEIYVKNGDIVEYDQVLFRIV